MSEFAFFVDEDYIRENTPIDDNVDAKLFKMARREAQDTHIRDVIGSGIYDQLCDQINADTLSALNTTLISNYIAPCLKYYVLYESAGTISFQILNKGISTRNSEYQQPADINAITSLMNRWKDKAEYYANRLRDYLCENENNYPLFRNPGSSIDTIYPNKAQMFGGIFLDGDEKKERRFSDKG